MKFFLCAFASLFLLISPLPAAQGLAEFTGAKTRVVWISQPGGRDLYAKGNNHTLWAMESGDAAPRKLLPEPGNYHTPLLSPDGAFVVYSDREKNVMVRVDWETGGQQEIGPGAAAALWRNPDDGRVYLYAQEHGAARSHPLVRFPIDAPDQREPVWDQSMIEVFTPGSLHLSRDGKRAAALFPWPRSGVAALPNGGMDKHRDGCWPGIAPDNSGVHWTFDGSHRVLLFNRPGRDELWKVDLSKAPGMEGEKVYHPRWTNHPSFLVMTGPYPGKDKQPSNILIGRFSGDFNAVEEWIQITDTAENAYFPSVWIKGGEAHDSPSLNELHAGKPEAPEERRGLLSRFTSLFDSAPELSEKWPGTLEAAVVLWEDHFANNRFTLPTGDEVTTDLELRGNARFGPAGQLHLVHGAALADKELSKNLVEAVREAQAFSFEAIVHPLEGEQDGQILSMSNDEGDRNFSLAQRSGDLILHLSTSRSGRDGTEFHLGSLESDTPVHVFVTYRPGLLVCSLDGREVIRHGFVQGDFKKWENFQLIFGSGHEGSGRWHGYLDSFAVYSRFIDGDEAAQKLRLAEERIAARPHPVSELVEARQLTRAEPPDAESVAPYRRVLVVNQYEITSGTGSLPEGTKVAVAEWAMLDGETPADYVATAVGGMRTLVLEDFSDHPQLESERQIPDMDAADWPLFHHVRSGADQAASGS